MKEKPARQSTQLQLSEARKTRQQPMWLEREREVNMQDRLKNYALVICPFVFLFVIIRGGLHLAPGFAFLAAVSGTPLVIFAFPRLLSSIFNSTPGRW